MEPYRYLVWLFSRMPLAATADDYAISCPRECLPPSTSEVRHSKTAYCTSPGRSGTNEAD
ncbi:hypothetical protein [Burkholderia territorii]|uniref:hypothetical protein n=1 Tax=Burkholderia territorii TaxID=1503055 RepID=UPI0039BF8AB1